MIEWAMTSSVLIAAVLILRRLLMGRISLRLQYGLWALVLVRLLLPVNLGSTGWSVLNAVEALSRTAASAVPDTAGETDEPTPQLSIAEPDSDLRPELFLVEPDGSFVSEMPPVKPAPAPAGETARETVERGAWIVWAVGAAGLGLWLAGINVGFARRLRRSRRPLAAEECPLPVYVTGAARTPCLFGLVRPGIYVTGEVAADETVLRHTLAHELTHFRHGDHLWAVLRGLCLALHWYNPLVWAAAVLSRRDGELCCDEATVRRLGEGERAAYGRTLLAVTCRGRDNPLFTATSMTGSSRGITERIVLLAKRPRTTVPMLAAVVLIAAVAVGCTFTGGQEGGQMENVGGESGSGEGVTDQTEEVTLTGLAVPVSDSASEEEIGWRWAKLFVDQFRLLSPEHPLYCTDSTVLECTLYARPLFSQPREQIYVMRFACHAADQAGFEQWYANAAQPLTGEEYPQYEGWMGLGWLVVLDELGEDQWVCINAGSGGYGEWGYLNYETGENWEQILAEQLSADSGQEDPEMVLRILPFVDWSRVDGEELNRLLEILDGACLTQGRVYGPEEDRMWSDVYPDDQAYRNLYVMLAALNTDGAYAEGMGGLLEKQQAYDPQVFASCLQNLTQEQQQVIKRLAGMEE